MVCVVPSFIALRWVVVERLVCSGRGYEKKSEAPPGKLMNESGLACGVGDYWTNDKR